MKNRAITVYISCIIILAAIGLMIPSFLLEWELTLNLSYGIFGSGVVTLIIYFAEYFSEKKKNFEHFYTSSIEALGNLNHVIFFDLNSKTVSLIKYLLFKDQLGDEKIKKEFQKEISQKISGNKKTIIPDEELIDQAKMRLSFLESSMKSYIAFLETDFHKMGLITGDCYFLFDFFKKRKERILQYSIYERIMTACKEINHRALLFKLFTDKEPSKISINDLVKEYNALSEIFFEKKEENGKKYVYSKYTNSLFDEIEKYRCCHYRKKYVPKQHKPSYESLE